MIDKPIPTDVIARCQEAAWEGGCTPELVERILRAAGWPNDPYLVALRVRLEQERDEARTSAAEWKKRAFGFDPEGVAAAARAEALQEAARAIAALGAKQ